jgi:hypothetical protein
MSEASNGRGIVVEERIAGSSNTRLLPGTDAFKKGEFMHSRLAQPHFNKSRSYTFLFALLILVLAASLSISAFAAGKAFTATVSDSMCGAKHEMAGDDASCTRACVSKGSKYALVVGDKVYTLETSDKDALATLDKQAGAKVTVMGTANGDTIAVSSVKAAQ